MKSSLPSGKEGEGEGGEKGRGGKERRGRGEMEGRGKKRRGGKKGRGGGKYREGMRGRGGEEGGKGRGGEGKKEREKEGRKGKEGGEGRGEGSGEKGKRKRGREGEWGEKGKTRGEKDRGRRKRGGGKRGGRKEKKGQGLVHCTAFLQQLKSCFFFIAPIKLDTFWSIWSIYLAIIEKPFDESSIIADKAQKLANLCWCFRRRPIFDRFNLGRVNVNTSTVNHVTRGICTLEIQNSHFRTWRTILPFLSNFRFA
ncbi:hypothetical protein Tco_0926069 [Tanacetum coccineum]|uniref:Uncharacterized protein n=1 Tax=Tanacetum coccineum TaxID=301880 RepID=A0ABQ5D9V8_9ASTR